jgi:hypothetical protein
VTTAVLAAWTAVPAAPAVAAGAAGTQPQVVVNPVAAAPGARVLVTGRGFPPTSDVQAQICGDRAAQGSVDCDLSASQEVATTQDGRFQLTLVVTMPPKPCPCVVMVLDFALTATPTTPFTVIGAPTAPTPLSPVEPLEVRKAVVEGHGPWTSWFGAAPQRTLVLTVHNPDQTSYLKPPLLLQVGSGATPSSREATRAPLASIGPGRTRTYRVPLTFPVLAVGDQPVHGVLGSPGLTTTFTVHTSMVPWGLVAVLALLVLLAIALVAWAVRRRRRHLRVGPAPVPVPPVVPAAGNGSAAAIVPEPVLTPVPFAAGLLEDGIDPNDPLSQLE